MPLHLGLLDKQLSDREFILGDKFQAPDIGVTYICNMADRLGELEPYKNLKAYYERNLQRDAWQRAKDRAVE